MPTTLLIVYRVLGTVLFALAAAAIVEKYRTVRGAVLLPARVLECRKAGSTSPGAAAGGYRYLVELHANGRRLEMETNPSGSGMTRTRARSFRSGTTPVPAVLSAKAGRPKYSRHCWPVSVRRCC